MSAPAEAPAAARPVPSIPLGSFIARIGNAVVHHRRCGKKALILIVPPWLGEQLRGAGRDRVHGLRVHVDARLQGTQIAIVDTLANFEAECERQAEAAAAKAEAAPE